jgi:hypothetical protein
VTDAIFVALDAPQPAAIKAASTIALSFDLIGDFACLWNDL